MSDFSQGEAVSQARFEAKSMQDIETMAVVRYGSGESVPLLAFPGPQQKTSKSISLEMLKKADLKKAIAMNFFSCRPTKRPGSN